MMHKRFLEITKRQNWFSLKIGRKIYQKSKILVLLKKYINII